MPPEKSPAPVFPSAGAAMGPAQTTTLVLVRHGETDWNREGRIMGTADIPLNEAGRSQARAAGAFVASFKPDRIVASPLLRARQTAETVAEAAGASLHFDERLVEVRFGDWQGRDYAELAGDERAVAFLTDPVNNRTPGGETIVDVKQRGLEALATAEPGETVAFVSHGDILRAVLSHYLAVPITEFRRIRCDNCGVSVVNVAGPLTEVAFVNALPDSERAHDPVHWRRGY